MRRLINHVRFEPAGVIVEFDEVYPNGLIRRQSIEVPLGSGSDYLDEVMAVQAAVEALVDDVLEDTGLMAPLTVEELMEDTQQEEEDDDDE